MTKHDQTLWDILGTVFPSTSEQTVGRRRIYHRVSDIQLPFSVHQGQYVYILS